MNNKYPGIQKGDVVEVTRRVCSEHTIVFISVVIVVETEGFGLLHRTDGMINKSVRTSFHSNSFATFTLLFRPANKQERDAFLNLTS